MSEGHSQTAGFSPEAGKSIRWRNIGATQLPDGSWALKVDTELVLDGANISISNIKIGSTNQSSSSLKYLKTLDDGTVVVTNEGGNPLEGYKPARSQDSGAFPHFFGMTSDDEDWVIIRESRTGNVSTFEYFAGTGSFVTNWNDRIGLVYDEFFNIF